MIYLIIYGKGIGVKRNTDSIIVKTTLKADSWIGESTPYTQTVNVVGVSSDENQDIDVSGIDNLTPEQYSAMTSAQLWATGKADGTVTITAFGEKKPEIDLPIVVSFQKGVDTTDVYKTQQIESTLLHTGWSGDASPFTQSINIAGITSNNNQVLDVSPKIPNDKEQANSILSAVSGLMPWNIEQGDGVLVFTAMGDTKPEVDIPFTVTIFG